MALLFSRIKLILLVPLSWGIIFFTLVKFHHINLNYDWILVNIYAPNSVRTRKSLWSNLKELKNKFVEPNWLFKGDFSVPLYEHENKGGNTTNLEGRMDFLDFINNAGLIDFDLKGIEFTWSNKRTGQNYIQARLDRVLASNNYI